jgi:hypothetical protein
VVRLGTGDRTRGDGLAGGARREGWYVNYGSVDVTGFPIHFRTGFDTLELADPDTGWLWTHARSDAGKPHCDPTVSARFGLPNKGSPRLWNA